MKKALGLLLFMLITSILSGLGGQLLGSYIFITWTHIRAQPSLTLLYTLYQHQEQLNAQFIQPFQVCGGISLLLPVIAVIIILTALLSKPKRELHGSARFATKAEISQAGLLKEQFTSKDYPDLLIGKLGKNYLRWSSNTFMYLAAPTRSGKGVGIVIPNCLHYHGSMVIYDPKLENFLITGGFRHDRLKQKIFLFNPAGQMPEHAINPNAPLVSHRWNPMTYIRRDPRYMYKDICKMADILIPKPLKDNGSSTFFAESAQKLFTGLVLYMLETEQERDLDDVKQKSTLANLFRMTAPTNGMTLSEWIKEEIELREQQENTKLSHNCKTLLYGFANGNAKTGADILATLTAPLGIFLDPVVEAATSDDDFLLTDVRKQRMTIYIGVIPTDTGPFSRLTNLFFSQLISLNVQQGLPDSNPSLKHQCLLLMDEFTALGVIPAIQNGVSYIAGYGLRLLIIIQSPSQVTDLYGRDATRTFFTNFDCHIVFTPANDQDADEYSKMIGFETFKARSISRSSGRGGSRSQNMSDQRRAVMLPQELKLMPGSECIISLARHRPIKAQKILYWQDPVFSERANLPAPPIPPLIINSVKLRVNNVSPVAQYVPEHELPSHDWRDSTNAEVISKALLGNLITPDSSPEFISELSKYIDANLGIDSMPVFKAVLNNT